MRPPRWTASPADCPRLADALHPLDSAPRGPAWNDDEIADLWPPDRMPAHAAVLVGCVPRLQGTQVLFTVRTDGLRHHAGQVSFPGGRIEPVDRDAVAAALRETHEELGIPSTLVRPLGYLDPLSTVTGFRVLPVVALVDPDYVAEPDPGEVAAVFEVPLAFLLDPGQMSSSTLHLHERVRTVWEYHWPGQRIWGATASMLLNLRQRLERLP